MLDDPDCEPIYAFAIFMTQKKLSIVITLASRSAVNWTNWLRRSKFNLSEHEKLYQLDICYSLYIMQYTIHELAYTSDLTTFTNQKIKIQSLTITKWECCRIKTLSYRYRLNNILCYQRRAAVKVWWDENMNNWWVFKRIVMLIDWNMNKVLWWTWQYF